MSLVGKQRKQIIPLPPVRAGRCKQRVPEAHRAWARAQTLLCLFCIDALDSYIGKMWSSSSCSRSCWGETGQAEQESAHLACGRVSARVGSVPAPPSLLCPVTLHRWGKGWAGPGPSWVFAYLQGKPISSGRGELKNKGGRAGTRP